MGEVDAGALGVVEDEVSDVNEVEDDDGDVIGVEVL